MHREAHWRRSALQATPVAASPVEPPYGASEPKAGAFPLLLKATFGAGGTHWCERDPLAKLPAFNDRESLTTRPAFTTVFEMGGGGVSRQLSAPKGPYGPPLAAPRIPPVLPATRCNH